MRAPSWHTLVCAAAAALRVALILYAQVHDRHSQLQYTDVDYLVVSDAGKLMLQKQNPFHRDTYRYSPLLAFAMIPNHLIHPAFGKLLFAASDMIVAILLTCILRLRKVSDSMVTRCVSVWIFSPLAVNISTRGNADSVAVALTLAALFNFMHARPRTAGAFLAGAAHMKPFACVFICSFACGIDTHFPSTKLTIQRSEKHLATKRASLSSKIARGQIRCTLLVAFSSTYILLAAMCLKWCAPPIIIFTIPWFSFSSSLLFLFNRCGSIYFREALLYHVHRVDGNTMHTPDLLVILYREQTFSPSAPSLFA